MRRQRNALIGALAWWFARRWLQRRAALAVPGPTGSSSRGRIGAVLGASCSSVRSSPAFWWWRNAAAGATGRTEPAGSRPPGRDVVRSDPTAARRAATARGGVTRPGLVRPALDGLVPYEPGKPVEEVQRELGLERVVKLASNEGPFGPFPAATEAMAAAAELNRYPDGGCYRLRSALAERHGVRFEEVVVCAGADAVIGFTCQATLDPGDEVVTRWPSFVSYVLDPLKLAARCRYACRCATIASISTRCSARSRPARSSSSWPRRTTRPAR